ncbi:MAG: redox-sensing transcriptional repressor Rex [Clostridia bacterium]|nr:redox-sensing transcriptional repressor Rex [Clostridia bacterium]
MSQQISKATLGRLPDYLNYLYDADCPTISATKIARGLGLGEVQVRKDLGAVCGKGAPKVGYNREELIADVESVLGTNSKTEAVVVGAGKLGQALAGYAGFERFGLHISASFDIDPEGKSLPSCPALPMEGLSEYCRTKKIKIGILTVPASCAKEVCGKMVECGITAIWNFAPVKLEAPPGVTIYSENLALSLAHLKTVTNN